MMQASIDYGHGEARIYGPFDAESAAREFGRLAHEMFGLRKSISRVTVTHTAEIEALPEPWCHMEDAHFVLEHNCGVPGWVFKDVAVWDSKGEKIKSEWD